MQQVLCLQSLEVCLVQQHLLALRFGALVQPDNKNYIILNSQFLILNLQ